MRVFLFFLLFLGVIWANDFSQKKIIKIDESQDNFELIKLNQTVNNTPPDSQKALFDSSTLKEKKAKITQDKKLDFAIVFSFRENFGYVNENFKKQAGFFSSIFSQNTLKSLKLNFINSAANGAYQSQKTLQNFSPKDAKLVNISSFLKKEEDRDKIYADFVDYIIVINLNDFYIETTNFIFTQNISAHAMINFKLIASTKGLIKSKNISLKLTLDKDKNLEENYHKVLNEMPKMLADVISDETKSLKI